MQRNFGCSAMPAPRGKVFRRSSLQRCSGDFQVKMAAVSPCVSALLMQRTFCYHLSARSFQRAKELFTVSSISSIIISSTLIPVRRLCIRGEKLYLYITECGHAAVPLGWEKFISLRLQLTCEQEVSRRPNLLPAIAVHICSGSWQW